MKKILMAIGVVALMTACSSGPEKAAEKFTENLAQGKVDKAKEYATVATGRMLDLANSFGGLPINPDFDFEMKKDSVVNNKAWVTFTNQEGQEDVIELVKIDGKWLVHMESKK